MAWNVSDFVIPDPHSLAVEITLRGRNYAHLGTPFRIGWFGLKAINAHLHADIPLENRREHYYYFPFSGIQRMPG